MFLDVTNFAFKYNDYTIYYIDKLQPLYTFKLYLKLSVENAVLINKVEKER